MGELCINSAIQIGNETLQILPHRSHQNSVQETGIDVVPRIPAARELR